MDRGRNQRFRFLKCNDKAPVRQLGDKDVLVKFHAASLNYRDIIIPKGLYPFPVKDGIVPGSDGAGTVEAVGSRVTRFKPGDKVVTILTQGHQAGSLDFLSMATGLGGSLDGTLREYGSFDETGLVAMPSNLDFLEASTLSCAAITAWNALYGLESRALKPGDYVLTQGTGGVSIFALRFSKAAGAKVIATTSSEKKAELLKSYGADHVVNYNKNPNWGELAKSLTPGGLGVNHVVEIGGPATMAQSLKTIKIDGVISIVGFLTQSTTDQPTFLECLNNICTVRGLVVGSRLQFEDMDRCIEANDIHPVVDAKVFDFDQVKDAYEYMWYQKYFGKLAIKIV